MIQKIKYIVASLVLSLGVVAAVALPVDAQGAAGAAKEDVCAGITAGGGDCAEGGAGLTNVIKLVIQVLSIIVGVASVIMIVVGGLKYVTSGGDSSKVASAKSTIIYAIVGLIITALAQFIVRFVLQRSLEVGGN